MPGVIGCIDGTHIKITAPSNQEWAYVNRKGVHSINVQVGKLSYFIYCGISQFLNISWI